MKNKNKFKNKKKNKLKKKCKLNYKRIKNIKIRFQIKLTKNKYKKKMIKNLRM